MDLDFWLRNLSWFGRMVRERRREQWPGGSCRTNEAARWVIGVESRSSGAYRATTLVWFKTRPVALASYRRAVGREQAPHWR